MDIIVIGLGYVGLANAAILSVRHKVTGYDVNVMKTQTLQEGELYLDEPYIKDYFDKFKNNLLFSSDPSITFPGKQVALIAVPTPSLEDGSCDLSALYQVGDDLIKHASKFTLVVIRSTVPPGTNKAFSGYLGSHNRHDLTVVSLPEFLSQGRAILDSMKPSRLVVGTNELKVMPLIKEMFHYDKDIPMMITTPSSAELIKYASNNFLAMKISYINEISRIAEKVGADIIEVSDGMGLDPRIGRAFLNAGLGYGGSCFPKDLKAMQYLGQTLSVNVPLVDATIKDNTEQIKQFADSIIKRFDGRLSGKRIAILGLSFKGGTSDIRNSPAFAVIDTLLNRRAVIVAYDKKAIIAFHHERESSSCIGYVEDLFAAIRGADAVVITNDSEEFKALTAEDFISLMKTPIVFDGRNLYNLNKMSGVEYHCIGR